MRGGGGGWVDVCGEVADGYAVRVSVDVEFEAWMEGEEAGITVFRSQEQHINLSIVAGESGAAGVVPAARQLRLRATTFGRLDMAALEGVVVGIPMSWLRGPIRFVVEAGDDEGYNFSAESTWGKLEVREVGRAGADIVTSGSGRFVGTLVGAYAMNNNGTGTANAYPSRWRYTPLAQKLADGGVYVDAKVSHPSRQS
ncbi:hypothetical protein V500_07513 [Pseudogymnoascus sp. VKM F-4518 (FW-2643)]|nr:hypothetical protein V500_07513 [Pseudogymnoascus sp. VKM F-4518 (FW-2643)]